MKRLGSHSKRGFQTTAPGYLIAQYKSVKRPDQKRILKRLLSEAAMHKAWQTLNEHFDSDRLWDQFVREIFFALKNTKTVATEVATTQGEIAECLEDSADTARSLIKMLTAPKATRTAPADCASKLDKLVYEYFPDSAIRVNDGQSWTRLNGAKKAEIAYGYGVEWPTLLEVLTNFKDVCDKLAADARSGTRTRRRHRTDSRLPPGAADFVRALSTYIRKITGRPLHTVVAAIATVVLEGHITGDYVRSITFRDRK